MLSSIQVTPVSGPSRVPTPVPTVPILSDRDRAEPLSALLFGHPTLLGSPFVPTADLDAVGVAGELHFGDSAAHYSHAG